MNRRAFTKHITQAHPELKRQSQRKRKKIHQELENTKHPKIVMRDLFRNRIKRDSEMGGVGTTTRTAIQIPPPACFPLQDYEWNSYLLEETRVFIDDNGDTVTRRVTVEETRIRKRNIQSEVSLPIVFKAIQAMDDNADIENIVSNLPYYVHLNPKSPRFHSICLTDMSRFITKMFCRNERGDCEWFPFQKSLAINELKHHAQNLLIFMLETGLEMIDVVLWHDRSNDTVALIITDESNKIIKLMWHEPLTSTIWCRDRQIDSLKLSECPEEKLEEANNLIENFLKHKRMIVTLVKRTNIDNSIIVDFLYRTRAKNKK